MEGQVSLALLPPLFSDPSPLKVRWIAFNTVMIDIIRLHNPLQKPSGPTQVGTLIFD